MQTKWIEYAHTANFLPSCGTTLLIDLTRVCRGSEKTISAAASPEPFWRAVMLSGVY